MHPSSLSFTMYDILHGAHKFCICISEGMVYVTPGEKKKSNPFW